jgi:CBS domain containing-hemolysin-like protein
VELGQKKGTIREEEKEMIHSVIDFGETYVREIMIPRIDMVAVSHTTPIQEIVELIRKYKYSRIPVFKDRIDNIQGILFAKDLLPFVYGKSADVNILSTIRPTIFIPEKKKIDDLLREFQEKKTNIAIVVDEYGGTSGMVTLEDVVEEIIGEIHDEYDEEEPPVQWLTTDTALVDARINLDDLEEIFSIKFPEERDYDTLGGLIYHLFGDIPDKGSHVSYKNLLFTIELVQGNRIQKVKINRVYKKTSNSEDTSF